MRSSARRRHYEPTLPSVRRRRYNPPLPSARRRRYDRTLRSVGVPADDDST
ncbi:MAG: hypothetical protein ABDI19_07135 [Armatimonadota bacterium]